MPGSAVCRRCSGGRATRRRGRRHPAPRFVLWHAGHQRRAPPLRVPFSYINNCRIDDPEFELALPLRARVRVVKTLKTMKIGQIGQRIDFFWSTIIAEAELLERFGIQVLPIDLVDTLRSVRRRTEDHRAAYRCELAEFQRWVSFNHYTGRRYPLQLRAS